MGDFFAGVILVCLGLVAVLALVLIVLSVISKIKLVKNEKKKNSVLLESSFQDDKSKRVSKNLDMETPKNKKYCPSCKALIKKKYSKCPHCGHEFKFEG